MKFVVDRKIIKFDMGDKQVIHIKKLGVLEYQRILGSTTDPKKLEKEDPIKLLESGINLVKRCIVNWEGFKNEKGEEVPFSDEVFEDFIESLSSEEVNLFMTAVMEVLEPTIKDKKKVKELNTDIKNLKTTSKK